MIARIWRGTTEAARADDYYDYLLHTGLKDYRAIEGNRGVYALRRVHGDRAEFTLISLWDSMEAIRRFAGDDVERAVYYPADDDFLLEKTPNVEHHEVLAAP